MSSFLITVFVSILVYLWASRFKHAAMWWNRVPALRDRGFDFAELDLPAGWRPGRDLNDSAGIEAVDLLHGRYAVVISESREDYDASLDLDTFAVGVRDSAMTGVRVLSMRGAERLKVDGCDAVQFEVEGVHEMASIKYLFTVVMGRRALHQIVAWSPRSAYNRKVFDELLAGFRERPGPAAEPRSYHDVRPAGDRPASAARVIGFRPASIERTPANAPRNGNAEPAQTASDRD